MLGKSLRCSKLCGICCRVSKLLSCGVTLFWFEAKCRCWVTSWRVAWLKLLQQVSSMLWPCQQRKHEDWVGLPTFHASSIFNEVLSKHTPSRLQSWWSYDPALVVLHDGIWDASISSVFGCRRSDDFCYFFAWLYIQKDQRSWISYAATPLRPAGVHCFQLPSRLPVAASAWHGTPTVSCHLSPFEADAIILQCPHEQGSRRQLHVHHHPPTLYFSIHGSGL